jgi:hypothetical protein
MESWQPLWIAEATRPLLNLATVCQQVRRLEELADRKLNSTPEDPPMRAKITDTALFLADRLAGLTLTELAQKYGVSPSTAAYWCRKLNGATPPQTNGQPSLKSDELEQLLLERWSRLPLLERVRILLRP